MEYQGKTRQWKEKNNICNISDTGKFIRLFNRNKVVEHVSVCFIQISAYFL